MSELDTKRIAALTTGAIKTTTDDAAKSMLATVAAAETKIDDLQNMIDIAKEKTHEVRVVVERFIDDFTRATGALADNVEAHVKACQKVIDLFQEHHLRILNTDIEEPVPPPGNGRNYDRLLNEVTTLHKNGDK
jgi:hypothetical protein